MARLTRCRLTNLPIPPAGKVGWPWTAETSQSLEDPTDSQLWPKISIVTPSFNQGKYIEETIRSVLLQNYPNLEYIVMDGGSTDESIQIIRKYAQFIDHFILEPNEGHADALNKGMKRATGEILAFINSDDLYLPEAFTTVAQE